MVAYLSFEQLNQEIEKEPLLSIAEVIARHEAKAAGVTIEEIRDSMSAMLDQMRRARRYALSNAVHSRTGLTGGDAVKIKEYVSADDPILVMDTTFAEVLAGALATAELNASMGRIVAAPTAGSAGVLPGVLIALADAHELDDEQLVDGLLVAGVIGEIFASTATLSGAAGGCQAEIGVASAMTAAAVCAVLGGDIEQIGHAASLAMQGLLGLVCDPVSGLVEVPCVARNATGSAVALAAAQMALAGIEFPLPLDEVVIASARIGAAIDPRLRETAQGGLAATPTAQKLCESIE